MKQWYYEVASVVAIIILEVIFWFSSDPLSGLPYLQPTADDAVPIAKRSLMSPKCNGGILLFGDSSCMFGLKAIAISDHLKVPCINFGTLSSFTVAGAESQIIEITKNYNPGAIVLVYIPRSFEIEEKKARDFKLVGRYNIAYNIDSKVLKPTFDDFQALFFKKHQFNLFPTEFGGSFESFKNILIRNQGYFPEFHQYTAKEEIRTEFHQSNFTKDALKAIDRIAIQKNIPLFLWISPSPSDAVDTNYINSSDAFIREIENSSDALKVVHDSPVWEPTLFATVTHLNDKGAEINSDRLSQYLKDQTEIKALID